ncbi:uncharacterized protein LOC103008868 isoform X2 [Balaenoptera acutorostrata]|uniref:Uncharacterized protein LOC103008868 isoform X2 n=1 Tax=Balaenoptera acutorostrata TaxID=9767 RepID=A0A383YWL7_BALAC|nr:uncharacterized protein LOC103008868 isoform X2 [Balaenoptera acutorostrata]
MPRSLKWIPQNHKLLYLLPWGGFLEVELMRQGISAFQRLGTGCQIVYQKGGSSASGHHHDFKLHQVFKIVESNPYRRSNPEYPSHFGRTLRGRAQTRILEQKQRPWHHPGRKTEGSSSHRTSEGSASPTKATRCSQASAKASAHPQRKWRNQPRKLMSAKHLKRLSSESHGKVKGCATDFTIRKLRHREVAQLAQGHTASKRQLNESSVRAGVLSVLSLTLSPASETVPGPWNATGRCPHSQAPSDSEKVTEKPCA